MPTKAASIPPSPQHPSPTLSIHPQILLPFTTPQRTTPRGTSMPMASTACHSNISKIWSQILPSIYAVVLLLIITKPLPNIPPFLFLHPPALQSLAMLLWRSLRQSRNPQVGPPLHFPVSPYPLNLHPSRNHLRVQSPP